MKPGDLVELRSGGPRMVISGWRKDPFGGEAGWVCWWSVQGALRRDTFPEVVLRPCDEPAEAKGASSP